MLISAIYRLTQNPKKRNTKLFYENYRSTSFVRRHPDIFPSARSNPHKITMYSFLS